MMGIHCVILHQIRLMLLQQITPIMLSCRPSIPNLDKQLKGYVLSKVRYINSDELLLAATFVGKKGAVLLRLNIPNKKIIQTQVISKKA